MDRQHVKSAADKARAASGKQPVRSRVFRSPLGDAPMSPPEAPTRSIWLAPHTRLIGTLFIFALTAATIC